MFGKEKPNVISFNYRYSTTKERELCTTCRALFGFANSLTKYEQDFIGSDLPINVLNDHKPNFSCSAVKGNLSPKTNFCTNAIDQSSETSHYLHERTKFSVADLSSRSFFLEQPQLTDVKQKQFPPQVLFAKLTHDDQIKLKPVQYLVKRETALPSLKDDCHPCLAHFGNHQIPNRKDKEVEKNVVETLESFCLMLFNLSKFQL